MYFVGYLNIMDMINAWKMESIKKHPNKTHKSLSLAILQLYRHHTAVRFVSNYVQNHMKIAINLNGWYPCFYVGTAVLTLPTKLSLELTLLIPSSCLSVTFPVHTKHIQQNHITVSLKGQECKNGLQVETTAMCAECKFYQQNFSRPPTTIKEH